MDTNAYIEISTVPCTLCCYQVLCAFNGVRQGPFASSWLWAIAMSFRTAAVELAKASTDSQEGVQAAPLPATESATPRILRDSAASDTSGACSHCCAPILHTHTEGLLRDSCKDLRVCCVRLLPHTQTIHISLGFCGIGKAVPYNKAASVLQLTSESVH